MKPNIDVVWITINSIIIMNYYIVILILKFLYLKIIFILQWKENSEFRKTIKISINEIYFYIINFNVENSKNEIEI